MLMSVETTLRLHCPNKIAGKDKASASIKENPTACSNAKREVLTESLLFIEEMDVL